MEGHHSFVNASFTRCKIFTRNLVFVGGVKGNFGDFLELLPHGFDRAAGQLDTLEEGRLRGVARDITLLDWKNILTRLKHGPVTQCCHTGQTQPRPRALIKRCT